MRARTRVMAAVVGSALCVAMPAGAKTSPSSQWDGTWRLDLARSRFSAAAPRAEVRSIEVVDGKMIVRSVVTPRSGKKMLFYYSVTLDGRFHRLSGNPDGDSISMRLVDPRRVDITIRRGGKTSARAMTQVSGDRLVMERQRFQLSGSPSRDTMSYRRVH